MGCIMNRQFWIDGFNFFHHWESTRNLLRKDSGYDIVRAITRSLSILSRHLGPKGKNCLVHLDGGLSPRETRASGLRVRYAGPGKKADDAMAADLLDLGDDARLITAVSNDRELKATLRSYGAACMGVSEFLAMVEGKNKKTDPKTKNRKPQAARFPGQQDAQEVMREKCRTLSPSEVKAWLDFFGGDDE